MVYINVRHTAADYEKWREVFDGDEARRRAGGATGINQIYRDADDPNTVNLILKNGGERRQAFRWLLADAIAPVLGVLSTLFFSLPKNALGIILAIFAGFFLYIGASDLLPESHHRHSTAWTTFMTVLGVAALYFVIQLAA